MAYNDSRQNYYPQTYPNHETAAPVQSDFAYQNSQAIPNNLDPHPHSNMTASYNEGIGASTTADGSDRDKGSHIVPGSSTGAPALPSRTPRPEYSREQSSYNPATGTGFTPPHNPPRRPAGEQLHPDQPPEGTSQQQASGSAATTSPSDDQAGAKIGKGIRDAFATIHGAGESLRGNVNAAIDRAFNQPEGVAKNEAIRREGEYEAQSGQLSASTKQREGLNTGDRRSNR